MVKCDQICPWNYYDIGCKKPNDELCPMSNLATKEKTQTNADRIRGMSDEELEDFLLAEAWTCDAYETCSVCPFRGEIGKGCMSTLEWLKQPAEE